MQKHLIIKVYGKVQGVFFRQSAVEKALELGVNGFARNESDGSVYIEAEGDAPTIAQFAKWCETGQSAAVVTRVETEEGAVKCYSKFEIRR